MRKFSWKLLRIDNEGDITGQQELDDQIIRRIQIDETVGDELWIKSSDIVIETLEPLPFLSALPAQRNWLALYINEKLWNVYQHPQDRFTGLFDYEDLDQKRGVYKFRLYPVQKIFYDDLKNTLVEYSATSTEWNYGLSDAVVTISQIEIHDNAGNPVTATDRYGFALGEMLESLALRHNNFGYQASFVGHVFPTINDDDLPILFRGVSKAISDTLENAVEFTFHEDTGSGEIFNMTWLDIFNLASLATNSFIKVIPAITGSLFRIEVSLIPKINQALITPIETVKWIERKRLPKRFQLSGVSLTGDNFEYQQGETESGHVFSRTFEIADYVEPVDSHNLKFYWATGDLNAGKYDLVSPYFAAGLVSPFYANMITAGDAYEGQVFINYDENGTELLLHVLDQIQIDAEIMQITQIRMGDDGITNIEGIVIA